MELEEPPLLISLIGNSTELNVPLKREPPGVVSASAQITQLQCPHTGSRRPPEPDPRSPRLFDRCTVSR